MTASKSLPLIRAKLYRPTVGPAFVHRPRLYEQLDRGLFSPLTLVCAPAGYGKTTLVSAWIEQLGAQSGGRSPLPCAWLSLDSRDDDLVSFMRYLVAAIDTVIPEGCPEVQELLKATRHPSLELLAATLNNEIAALPARLILVLDDYSAISSEAVHSLFNELLRQWPQPLHLVLITRRDPPFALAQPRARGMVTEIRADDLRFTREEITEYLALNTSTPASQAVIEQLDRTTEGWIAGLQISVRSSRGTDTPERQLAPGPGGAYIASHLFDQVLSSQPEPIHAFLLKTAILERYCESLAVALIGGDDPACDVWNCMRFIERTDLFIAPLDNHQEWYRYHHLFRDLLQRRLAVEYSSEEIARLHERAAGWFGERGLIDEALHHALEAGNLDMAARTIERSLNEALNREDPLSLERWLDLLPDSYVAGRPGLLLARAWVLQFAWQLAAQARIVEQVEALLNSGDGDMLTWQGDRDLRIVRGQIALMNGQRAFLSNQPLSAMAHYEEALALLPESWAYARGGAVLQFSMCQWAAGGDTEIVQSLLDRYGSLINQTDLYALRHLLAACFISLQAGELGQTLNTAQAMLSLAQRGRSALMQNWAHYFLGLVHLERNDLPNARDHFWEMVTHPHTTFMAVLHDGFAGMALVHQAQGDGDAAMRTLITLSELDLDRIDQEDARTRSLRAKLQLLQGNVEDAGRWADAFTAPAPDQPLLWMETPHLTRARILISRGRDSDLATALQLLDALSDLSLRTHNTTYLIRILALRALALAKMGQPEGAEDVLRQAVELARPGGFVRVFVDLGLPMKALLRQLSGQAFAVETIRRILNAFPDPNSEPMSGEPETRPACGDGSPVEPLTARELEVLALLQKRLSDKEIARELFLSTATVQRHAANIYGKLGVHRRSDAVAEAEALGLLPPS